MLNLHYRPEPLRLPGLIPNSFCSTIVLRPRRTFIARLRSLLAFLLPGKYRKAAENVRAAALDCPSDQGLVI